MTLTLPSPISANRYWRIMRNRVVRSAEASEYKRAVADIASKASIRPADGPVEISLTYHPRQTKNGVASRVRLDTDNVIKVALDALNGIAYLDDSQVVKLTAEIGSPAPGGALTVTVTPQAGWTDA